MTATQEFKNTIYKTNKLMLITIHDVSISRIRDHHPVDRDKRGDSLHYTHTYTTQN